MSASIAALAFLLHVSIFAAECDVDLKSIPLLPSKGRVQDSKQFVSLVDSMVKNSPNSLRCLAFKLESEYIYPEAVIPLWPEVREGDVALVIISDLFLDPSLKASYLPELCWDVLLGRSATNEEPAWLLLEEYLQINGRHSIHEKWENALKENWNKISWDKDGRYFLVNGRTLSQCKGAARHRLGREPISEHLDQLSDDGHVVVR